MNEKFVHIDVTVDTTNPEQIAALSTFLTKVGEHATKVANSLSEVREKINKAADALLTQIEKHTAEGREPEPQPEKPAKLSKPAKAPKVEPKKPEPEPEPQPKPEKPAAEEKTYQVEEVREKLKEKVYEHREEIKAKLTELGAPNVSSLDPSKYTEFVDFLEGLE